MLSTSIAPESAGNPVRAHDIEVGPEEPEYHDVVACLPDRRSRQCKVLKVIRHQIPAALFNGGSGCRVSWSVLAAAQGERLHYTIYNRELRLSSDRRKAISRLLSRSRYYLGGCRQVCCAGNDFRDSSLR